MVKAFFISFCCVLQCLISPIAPWVVEDEGCRTPNKGVGTCITIHQCQPIIQFLKDSPKPLSQENAEILRSYQCGFEGKTVKVCCPTTPIVNPVPSRFPQIPNVDRHPNKNLLPACEPLDDPYRIINGNKTGLFEFPWMVLLSYQTSNGPDFRCGGTIINKRYILTAAHCLSNLGGLRLIGVRVGEHDISKEVDCEMDEKNRTICAPPVQDLAIEEIIPHQNYNRGTYQNDIGLIRLATNIDLSVDTAKPVCLPFSDYSKKYTFRDNVRGLVTGWGATETGRSSPDLLKVTVPLVNNDVCNETYKRQTTITYKQICAGGSNNRDSCGGDSGGPLYSINEEGKQVQQGIVSFGPKLCGKEGYPGVYTRVIYFMDWILNTMRP